MDVIFPIPSTEDLYLTKPVRYEIENFTFFVYSFPYAEILFLAIFHICLVTSQMDRSYRYLNQNIGQMVYLPINIKIHVILPALRCPWNYPRQGSSMLMKSLAVYLPILVSRFALYPIVNDHESNLFKKKKMFVLLGMILKSGPKDWVWDELRDIAEMDFRFLDKIDASDYAVNIANFMQLYPPELVLCGDKLQFEKDLDASFEILSMLQPSNSLIFLSHKQFQGKTTLTEQWYHTEYNLRTFDEANQIPYWDACLQHAFTEETNWMNNLHLPQPNPFIPTDFTLKHANSISPEGKLFFLILFF